MRIQKIYKDYNDLIFKSFVNGQIILASIDFDNNYSLNIHDNQSYFVIYVRYNGLNLLNKRHMPFRFELRSPKEISRLMYLIQILKPKEDENTE